MGSLEGDPQLLQDVNEINKLRALKGCLQLGMIWACDAIVHRIVPYLAQSEVEVQIRVVTHLVLMIAAAAVAFPLLCKWPPPPPQG